MTQPRIDQLRELIERDPDDHTLHYMIGLEFLEGGRLDETIVHLEKYLGVEETKKGDVGACLGRLAEAYRSAGRMEEARRAYRRGIESAIAHQHADLRNELASALRALESETGSG